MRVFKRRVFETFTRDIDVYTVELQGNTIRVRTGRDVDAEKRFPSCRHAQRVFHYMHVHNDIMRFVKMYMD